MCGIVGAVGSGPTPEIGAAVSALGHRGPDAHGVFRGDGVVLGHSRLAIIDLSEGGKQPMTSAHTTLVFNGEIYNHHALRDELRALGHRFRSRSDSEVILEGYLCWGEHVVERLDGMFAFALWDDKERRLLLARDRAGKKPLYFAEGALPTPHLCFASEIKALGALGLPLTFEPRTLPMLLALGYVPAPSSLYAGVSQLPPAHAAVFTAETGLRTWRYWRSPFAEPTRPVPLAEAQSGVRRLVEAAVERRLEADVPLGAFLSGGVDSSIVVGVMRRALGRPVKTFSIGFRGDPRYDETRYARLAARTFATDHTELTLEPSSFDLVEALVAMHDGPFGDSSAIPTSVVSMLTRREVTVALTGDGGDELFCGYTRFVAAEAAEHVPARVRRLARALALRLPAGRSQKGLFARGVRFVRAASRPLPERLYAWSGYFVDDTLLRPELAARCDLDGPRAWSVAQAPTGVSPLQTALGHNFATYLPYDLLVKADRCSMMHGLELRSPFLDTALVDYAASLPDAYKRRGTETKWILKRAFSHLLPDEILRRGKMGFGVPLGAWFRGELRGYLQEHLSGDARLFDYLARAPVARLLEEHAAGRADHGQRLWLLLTLEVWLRRLKRAS